MADPSQCPKTDLGDAISQVVVVAFDFAGEQVKNLPELLNAKLQSPDVQKSIREGLQTFALKKIASGTSKVTDEEAKELIKLGETVGGKIGDGVAEQIKKSGEYKRLEEKLKGLEKTLQCSPMGVFIDENKALVFVVGIGVAFGTAAVLFLTKTGGPVIDLPIGLLKEKPVQIFKVGGFTLKGQLLDFKPDKQILGAGVVVIQQWKKVDLTFKIGVIAAGTDVTEVKGQAIVKSTDFSVTVDGEYKPLEKKINIGLGLGFESSTLPGPLKISVGALIDDGQLTSGTLKASMKAGPGVIELGGSASGKETRGLATFTIPW
ncbi:MAG: hypothetical protein H7Y20_18610 [Bryobacteraceae bacterium]|nr:hypothetical protein [Bryobacteraceae bacterium]